MACRLSDIDSEILRDAIAHNLTILVIENGGSKKPDNFLPYILVSGIDTLQNTSTGRYDTGAARLSRVIMSSDSDAWERLDNGETLNAACEIWVFAHPNDDLYLSARENESFQTWGKVEHGFELTDIWGNITQTDMKGLSGHPKPKNS